MKTHVKWFMSLGVALCSATTAPAALVTFQVNMSVQTALGTFDPANDFVFLAGGFNAWSETAWALSPSVADPDIYEGTFEVTGTAGSTQNYKFIKNRLVGGLNWENDGVGPGGVQNRQFQLEATDQVLPVVYFNNIDSTDVNHAAVTFQVNMSVQIGQGTFDPDFGTLLVAGGAVNDWDITVNPLMLTRSLSDPDLWLGTFNVTNPAGSTVSYKYTMNGAWESINNRTFVLSNAPQTLPVVFFNNVTNLASPIPLTFRVNMGVQIALGNFDPEFGVVEARGSFFTAAGAWEGGFVLTNDAASPLIYSGTFVDINDAPGSLVQYQFVLNSGTTWETTGNRQFTIASTNEQTAPLVFFSNVTSLGPVSTDPMAGGQALLNWTGGPRVRLQSATPLISWSDVPGTEGQSAAIVDVTADENYFRLIGP